MGKIRKFGASEAMYEYREERQRTSSASDDVNIDQAPIDSMAKTQQSLDQYFSILFILTHVFFGNSNYIFGNISLETSMELNFVQNTTYSQES